MTKAETMDAKTKKIAMSAIGIYLLFISILAISGHFAFVSKTAVVPVIFLVALITNRTISFVKEWGVFLCLIILFDSLRGYIFYLIKTMDLRVYMNYVITPELHLFGGKILTEWFQQLLYTPGKISTLDKLLTVIHGSHFVFFLLFGLATWYFKKNDFPKYKLGMLIVMYGGLFFYFIFPTVPPWMAASHFHVIPELPRIFIHIYNTNFPQPSAAFDTNPIAAMPSLHTAFPTFLTLAAVYRFRYKSIPIIAYWLLMIFALFYGGEHYFLDIVAGACLASFAFWLAYIKDIGVKVSAFVSKSIQTPSPGLILRTLNSETKQRLALAAFVLAISQVLGFISISNNRGWEPNEDFIRHELVGKSDIAEFQLARVAFEKGDTAKAQNHLMMYLKQVRSQTEKQKVRLMLAEMSFNNKDYEWTIRYLNHFPEHQLSVADGKRLVIANMMMGNHKRGFDILDNLEVRFACVPSVIFLHTYHHFLAGHLSAENVRDIANRLSLREGDPQYKVVAEKLNSMLRNAE